MSKQVLVSVVIIFSLGALLAFYYHFIEGTQPLTDTGQPVIGTTDQSAQNNDVKNLTGLEAAEKIYAYIEAQRRQDGLYEYASKCDERVCNFDFTNPHGLSNAWAAYAETGLYDVTGDSSYLDAARADGEKILGFCGTNEGGCVSIIYQIVALYEVTGDPRYIDLAKAEADILMNRDDLYDSGFTMLIGGDSKGLARLSQSSGDATYSTDALKVLSGEIAALENEIPVYVYSKDGSTAVYKTYACWPQLARTHLYEATGDESHLEEARRFADSLSLPDYASQMVSATDIEPCIELYQKLATATGDQSYRAGADRMIQYVLTNYMDKELGSVRFASDKGFSTLTDSAYMVYLLTKSSDSIFEVDA